MGLKQENYTTLQGWMALDLGLKGNELIIFAIIYGFSQEESQCFTGSLGYLEEWTGATKPTVISALKSLQSKGFITKDEQMKNGVRFCRYRANFTSGKEILPGGGKESLPGGGKEILPNNKSYITNDSNNKDISIVGQDRPKIPYTDIVLYLNHVAGTNYKPSSKKTRDLIQARFNEGFTADDFKTVIDKKARDWRNDPKYSKFLRPETLFGTKFEGYLNQPMREPTTRDLADQFDYSDW